MSILNESLQQVCLSIERLEPCEEGLHKLLSLTMAAHYLLSDDELESHSSALSQERLLALDILHAILEKKLYLHSKQDQLQNFEQVKDSVLSSLNKIHN
jgi:hypothetical protein